MQKKILDCDYKLITFDNKTCKINYKDISSKEIENILRTKAGGGRLAYGLQVGKNEYQLVASSQCARSYEGMTISQLNLHHKNKDYIYKQSDDKVMFAYPPDFILLNGIEKNNKRKTANILSKSPKKEFKPSVPPIQKKIMPTYLQTQLLTFQALQPAVTSQTFGQQNPIENLQAAEQKIQNEIFLATHKSTFFYSEEAEKSKNKENYIVERKDSDDYVNDFNFEELLRYT